MKAFLLHAGIAAAQLRTGEMHDHEQLVEQAQDRGLKLAPEFVATLQTLQRRGAFGRARYLSWGAEVGLGLEHLSDLCNALAPLVGPPVFGEIPPAQRRIIALL